MRAMKGGPRGEHSLTLYIARMNETSEPGERRSSPSNRAALGTRLCGPRSPSVASFAAANMYVVCGMYVCMYVCTCPSLPSVAHCSSTVGSMEYGVTFYLPTTYLLRFHQFAYLYRPPLARGVGPCQDRCWIRESFNPCLTRVIHCIALLPAQESCLHLFHFHSLLETPFRAPRPLPSRSTPPLATWKETRSRRFDGTGGSG